MSGGSMNYLYSKVDDATFDLTTNYRIAFKEHLNKIARALKAIEWNDSGDGDENEVKLVLDCLTTTELAKLTDPTPTPGTYAPEVLLQDALGSGFVLFPDIYRSSDHWVGRVVEAGRGGYEDHSVRTCCPSLTHVLWTSKIVRIEKGYCSLGDGDGYHRSFDDVQHFIHTVADMLKNPNGIIQ